MPSPQHPDTGQQPVGERWTIYVCPHKDCPGRGEVHEEPFACYFDMHPDTPHTGQRPLLDPVEVVPALVAERLAEALGALLGWAENPEGSFGHRRTEALNQARAALEAYSGDSS